MATRPTPDRVREALFSMLSSHIDGADVLDLFAGTGALGIESLSRGARSAVFVENDPQALIALRKNLEVVESCTSAVLATTASRAINQLARDGRRFDLAFLDPPYQRDLLAPSLAQLAGHQLIHRRGLVVCEHSSRDIPPASPEGWQLHESRSFGDVAISLFAGEGAYS
jgi:16S rRNA (guanine(966)-N(2))-methyltransferase RsmD